jgi:hypothetical protein
VCGVTNHYKESNDKACQGEEQEDLVSFIPWDSSPKFQDKDCLILRSGELYIVEH